MAEVVVEFVLKNLADFIVKEAQFLGGVGEKVERVQRELTRIKCCLKDADSKKKGDERVQNWLNELRDVAYHIADATDTYFLAVEDHHQKEASSFQQKLKKVFKKHMKLTNLHKLGTELDKIQNLLQEISESRDRYGIKDQPLEDKSKGEAVRMPRRTATYSDVDENQVVGMEADKDNILKLLHPEQTPKLAVITIVGPGGLGKTTLAHMVYRSAKADFDYHIMLSISQQFSLIDLLRKMIIKYNKDFVRENQDVGDLAYELRSYLSSRKYMIILDDVWAIDILYELKNALPDVNNGSRILITSRIIEVARFADSQIPPYELKFLDDRESLDLLLKKALPFQEPIEYCPNDLHDLAHKLSKICNGLPLAVIVLGGILATKELSYLAWERVLRTLSWYSDGGNCMQILAMSYEDMPYYLKACFQYLASFPEDHVISAKCLIRMWAAEGFIPLKGRRTTQIMAEDCLEELSERSMVQVLSRSTNGLIKHFKVHDILRDLAVHEAMHENFFTVFSQASNSNKPYGIIRRASLQAQEKNSRFMEYIGPNTRSLLLFGTGHRQMSLDCSNFRLLKVLEIVGIAMSHIIELKSLNELIHLKYLGIRGCSIDLPSFSLHRMKSLETLDVRGTHCSQPFNGLWTMGKLRYVLADNYGYCLGGRPLILEGILLSNLETLKWVTVKRACDAKLPNLRKLGISNESDEWVSITNLLQTLPFLVSLGICSEYNLPMDIVYPKALPNYQNLQFLYLHGPWPENVYVEATMLPPHLLKLSLRDSKLNHNPMLELGKLRSLKKLCLRNVFSDDWEGPIICPEGFPVLQYLIVGDWNIQDMTVAQGVMPNLTYLQVRYELELHLPPELQHVIGRDST